MCAPSRRLEYHTRQKAVKIRYFSGGHACVFVLAISHVRVRYPGVRAAMLVRFSHLPPPISTYILLMQSLRRVSGKEGKEAIMEIWMLMMMSFGIL